MKEADISQEVIRPRTRGFICTSAHPTGCAREVEAQILTAREQQQKTGGKMLVVGSSMGYGLATRITGAFTYGMDTLGVAFERPARGKRSASAGWYNTAAFHDKARAAGLECDTLLGDAFSTELLDQAVEALKRGYAPLDYFVYSVAAPRRTDPVSGEEYHSALKTTEQTFHTRFLDVQKGTLAPASFEPATEEEIRHTVKVMGGEDLERWTLRLKQEGLLAPGCRVIAYSYVGPKVTHPVYREGTIGHAKKHLEATCRKLDEALGEAGSCHAVVAKSIVTQSSAAIPAISLYMSLAFRVMREHGLHEDAMGQIQRLFKDHIGPGCRPRVDDEGRIRIDDWEMRPEIQQEISDLWDIATEENVKQIADVDGFYHDFLRLFGFDIPGVDYEAPVETEVELDR